MNPAWSQNYDPLGNVYLSTLAAAIPAASLFYLLAIRRTAAWKAAIYAFVVAIVVAIAAFGMPAQMVAGAVAHGLVYGLFRIAWVVIAAVFVYELTVESGQFEVLKQSISAITADQQRPCRYSAASRMTSVLTRTPFSASHFRRAAAMSSW